MSAPQRRATRAGFTSAEHQPVASEPSLQQHDLIPTAAAQVAQRARIQSGELIIEVGPGLGNLTAVLLDHGARVVAAELDPARTRHLATRFAKELSEQRLTVILANALGWQPLTEGRPWRVVANPPFQHTAELVRQWVLGGEPPQALDLVMQRETAQKLCGLVPPAPRWASTNHSKPATPRAPPEPGALHHSRTSALLALAGRAVIAGGLTRDSTVPPSRVDLVIWNFRRGAEAPSSEELMVVDRLLAIAFAGPHTVAQALRGVASPIQLRRQGQEHGWHPDAHPRTVSAGSWLELARLLRLCGKL